MTTYGEEAHACHCGARSDHPGDCWLCGRAMFPIRRPA